MKAIAAALLALLAAPALAQAKPEPPKLEPMWQAFAAVFNAKDEINLTGRIIRTEWLEPKSIIWVQGSAGSGAPQLWRVDTGAASLFADSERGRFHVGERIEVHGFNARDTSCSGFCRMAGRTFHVADGAVIRPRVGEGLCTMDQLIHETCAIARRPGPPPAVN